jgi:DNA polymerase III alpha subunit (gram-positive type)
MIIKFIGPSDKIMFLGHNCQFDIDFTNQLVTDVGLPKMNLHHVKLDTSALGFITLGLYKSDHLFQRMGFSRPEKHNALDDVKMTLTTCQIINGIMKVEASRYLGDFEWLN